MTKRRGLIIAGLCALVALAGSCTRSDVIVPSPAGPSTLAVTFDLSAAANVILAGDLPPTTTIKATVRKNGIGVPDLPVYFTILSGPGQFLDYTNRVAATTDSTGVASVVFVGPTKAEMSQDMTTLIQGQMQTGTPEFIYKTIEIRIIRGAD
jgi:hypothetical protein